MRDSCGNGSTLELIEVERGLRKFDTYVGVNAPGLLRINPDGTRDCTFIIGAGGAGWAGFHGMQFTPKHSLLTGGEWNFFADTGTLSTGMALLEPASHSRILDNLSHNLLTVLLVTLESAGLTERKVLDRRALAARRQSPDKRVPTQEMVRHALCLTCQFNRLIRHYLRYKNTVEGLSPLFERRLAIYL